MRYLLARMAAVMAGSLRNWTRRTVKFTLTPDDLAIYDQSMVRRVEPGTFNVMVGSSSEQIRLRGSFEVK